MNIKLLYKMRNIYNVEEILCCDCYFDEVCFCLRNKYSIEKFNEKENCFTTQLLILSLLSAMTFSFFKKKKKIKTKKLMLYCR